MPGELLYLDSSALVKLVVAEAETGALLQVLAAWPHRVTSALAICEVLRATRRSTNDRTALERAGQVVDGVHCLPIEAYLLQRAGLMEPIALRSLDAIHLASALSLGADLGAAVIYDVRLADAARANGLEVLMPA